MLMLNFKTKFSTIVSLSLLLILLLATPGLQAQKKEPEKEPTIEEAVIREGKSGARAKAGFEFFDLGENKIGVRSPRRRNAAVRGKLFCTCGNANFDGGVCSVKRINNSTVRCESKSCGVGSNCLLTVTVQP
jgi:hypothetical protein